MRVRFWLQLAFTLLVCLFLVVPVFMSVLAGVTENYFIGFRSGLTLRWIGQVWELYARTIYLSIGIALACLAVTLLLGVPAAYALARSQNRWARAFEELLVLPVAVPGLATALALILFYGEIRAFRASWTFILVGHVLFTLPFMVRSVLAVSYGNLFPRWQRGAQTVAAVGESLPFADGSFDVVLCDNVVDHAESPKRIVSELARILVPGGLLYFTVNVHHRMYAVAAGVHASWRAVGVPFEIGPFADHTTHLTLEAAEDLFQNLPLQILSARSNVEEARARARKQPPRHAGDRLKRLFFKNALYEVVARRA